MSSTQAARDEAPIRTIDRLIGHYAESHRHPVNVTIHWICVPLIVWCTLALIYLLEPIAAFASSMLALVYYGRLSVAFMALMAVFAALCLLSYPYIENLAWVALSVFVLTWIAQFIGHEIEGKKPSFLEDLQYLLVGPIFLLSKVFRRLGWRY